MTSRGQVPSREIFLRAAAAILVFRIVLAPAGVVATSDALQVLELYISPPETIEAGLPVQVTAIIVNVGDEPFNGVVGIASDRDLRVLALSPDAPVTLDPDDMLVVNGTVVFDDPGPARVGVSATGSSILFPELVSLIVTDKASTKIMPTSRVLFAVGAGCAATAALAAQIALRRARVLRASVGA